MLDLPVNIRFLLSMWQLIKLKTDERYRYTFLIENFGRNPKNNKTLYQLQPFLIDAKIFTKKYEDKYKVILFDIDPDRYFRFLISNILVNEKGEPVIWDMLVNYLHPIIWERTTDYLLKECKLIGINVTFPDIPSPNVVFPEPPKPI